MTSFLCRLSVLLLLTGLTVKLDAATAKPGSPNILFILSEDIGPDLSCYGTPLIKTPNLDALAARASLSASKCSRAR